jgi:hypothetical protein
VKVTFVDDSTGQAIAVADLTPEQLPESFLEPTTLELGGGTWSVVSADLPTRREYATAAALTLRLARLESVDPASILFSLPTLCDQLPLDAGALAGNEQILAEDDWRQVELVSAAFGTVIAEELAAIRHVYETERQGVGFTRLHVRSTLPEPLAGAEIALGALDGWGPRLPLAFRDHAAPIAGGFAAAGLVFYGQAHRGLVVALGFGHMTDALVPAAAALARRARLVAVDWCGCQVAGPDEAEFAHTLVGAQ